MRALALVLLVAAAALAGAAASFVHRTTVDVLGVEVPVGMVAALAALAGLTLLARLIGRTRTSVALVGAAFAVPVLVLSQFRPEGDLVIAEDVWGLTLIGGAALVITVGVVVPFLSPVEPSAEVSPADRLPTEGQSTEGQSPEGQRAVESTDEPAALTTPERP